MNIGDSNQSILCHIKKMEPHSLWGKLLFFIFKKFKKKYYFSDNDYIETWKAMEKLVEIGLVKSIGVSNFNSEQLTRLLSIAKIKPVCNQVECNPNINQKKLIKFCKELNIVVVAYCPLRMPINDNPDLPKAAMSDDNIKAIAEKYNKSTAQVILRYLVRRAYYMIWNWFITGFFLQIENGAVPIPKSVTKQRIADNFNVFDFKLTADERSVMDSFETGKRFVPFSMNLANKYYPFNIEYWFFVEKMLFCYENCWENIFL